VHHDHIARAGKLPDRPPPRPVHRHPHLGVQKDPVHPDPSGRQRLDLPLQVPLGGRHPRIPQLHTLTVGELDRNQDRDTQLWTELLDKPGGAAA